MPVHHDKRIALGGEAEPLHISVVMPVYNGERYMVEAIDSILAQSWPHFEFIIIDDGSTDRTWDILEQYAASDHRVRIYRQANIDQPATLNRALSLARHEWVAIMDHDDISLPERLERQVAIVMSHPDVRLVGTFAIRTDADGTQIEHMPRGPVTVEEFQHIRETNDWISLIHSSVLMHRDTILELGGYDPAFGPSADTELWSRVSDNHLVLSVTEPLVLYRFHSTSMSWTRYFEQQRTLQWIRVRQLARRAGEPIPSVDELARMEAKASGVARLKRARRERVAYLRRRGRLDRIEGQRARYLLQMVGVLILDPRSIPMKLWSYATSRSHHQVAPLPPAEAVNKEG